MSFLFRKTIKILPGVRLNLSKSGVSASLGPRGATVNKKMYSTKQKANSAEKVIENQVSLHDIIVGTAWILLSGFSFYYLSFWYGFAASIVWLFVVGGVDEYIQGKINSQKTT